MRYRTETITPERARSLLDRTDELGFTNRSIRRGRVEKLAHAITLGQWKLTHQPLAITPDGAVMDGQHRLHAIVAAGQAVDMLVVRDADPETFGVVDTGAARTTADSLKIAGYVDVNHLSATVRGYIVYDQLIGTTGNYRTSMSVVTTADVLTFLDDPDQREAARGAVQVGRMVAGGLARHGLGTALGMSALVVRLRKTDLGDTSVAEFYARLNDGVSLAADSPILALRRWFMSDTGYARISNEARRAVACANTIKALNDYALGKPRSVVRFGLGVEPFPGPLAPGAFLAREEELADQERRRAGEE
jgi:hypothetical protein